MCDGISDCMDGSDESNCGMDIILLCSVKLTVCLLYSVIYKHLRSSLLCFYFPITMWINIWYWFLVNYIWAIDCSIRVVNIERPILLCLYAQLIPPLGHSMPHEIVHSSKLQSNFHKLKMLILSNKKHWDKKSWWKCNITLWETPYINANVKVFSQRYAVMLSWFLVSMPFIA